MPIQKTFLKRAWDYIPFLKDQGLEYLLGTKGRNKQMLDASYTVAGSGGGSVTVTFASLFGETGLQMEDTNYTVMLTADLGTAGGTDEEVTWSAKTVDGFTINGVVDGDIVDVIVIGRQAGQP